MLANLVYPSISSLVSKIVDEDAQGEALGALNGIKVDIVFRIYFNHFERMPCLGCY